jgi:hypothetical protein
METMLEVFKKIYLHMSPYCDEKLKRLLLGSFAIILGHGGILSVSKIAKVDRQTVAIGKKELLNKESNDAKSPVPKEHKKTRRKGGGRKKITEIDLPLRKDLDALISPLTRGDPESPLRWTCKSSRKLAEELCKMGHKISHMTVTQELREMGYSLQANSKVLEGASHPDRNEQFEYINGHAELFQWGHQPVISVDTKKKELIGPFKNAGKELSPKGKPEEVNVYDFPDNELGRVNPYGVYDIARNEAWVNVGRDNDTSEFAVESIRRWWLKMGSGNYPYAKMLYITADGGGSNGYRVRLWKKSLQAFANETGLVIHVSHFPPGTSKWNKIEHRLFSYISQNWRGKPLISHEVVVKLIGGTTTRTGLVVGCEIDENTYPKGIKISDEEMEKISITKSDFHGEWNYRIIPQQVQML